MWASNPIAPVAVKAANARLCPMLPIRRGAHQHPMKNPKKCADPKSPICCVEYPRTEPDSASRGPTPPELSCNSNRG